MTNAAALGSSQLISDLDMRFTSVDDDGRGFAPETTQTRGFGLFSIEQRMARIGARLHIASMRQHGTRACLPLRAAAAGGE